jgi:hypothetical protein
MTFDVVAFLAVVAMVSALALLNPPSNVFVAVFTAGLLTYLGAITYADYRKQRDATDLANKLSRKGRNPPHGN